MIICKICGREFKNYNGLGHHIKTHKISTKEYYDTYFKQDSDDVCHCEDCTNKTTFRSISVGYSKFCSIQCLNKSSSHKENIAKTKQDRYDDPFYSNRVKYKETMTKKYGCTHNWSGKARESTEKTWINQYGVDNPWKSKEVQKKCRDSFAKSHNGKHTPFEITEVQQKAERKANTHESRQKANRTKESNGHRSKLELYFIDLLRKNNINFIDEYSSEDYPYLCDFYLPDTDCYVEINNYWSHKDHLFDENNPGDIAILHKWQEKAKTSKAYQSAIEVWTKSDVEKYNTVVRNKLNYKILYSKEDIDAFIMEMIE